MTTYLEDGNRRQYQHEGFRDAGAQMRLLEKVIPDENDEIPSYTLTTWDFATVPEHTAISYTWGTDFGNHFIRVDESLFQVGDNCFWALKRANTHAKYLWIDSICINQENLDEKSSQVAMMGHIFQRASCVLAYIGAEANDSAMLLHVLGEVGEYVHSRPFCDGQSMMQALDLTMRALWKSRDRSVPLAQGYRSLATALRELGNRRYWQRLWIIQELWLAKEVTILCGEVGLGMALIAPVLKTLDWEWIAAGGGPWRATSVPTYQWGYTSMYRLMQEVSKNRDGKDSAYRTHDLTYFWTGDMPQQCSDYRDRVYALLKLIKWDGPPLRSDYTVGKLEFVLRVIACYGHSGVYADPLFYMRLLRLSKSIDFCLDSTAELREMLHSRLYRADASRLLSTETQPAALTDASEFPRACRLELNKGCMPLIQYFGREDPREVQPELFKIQQNATTLGHQRFNTDRITLLLGKNARSGDFLIQPNDRSRIWLVGRSTQDSDRVDLYGYAVICNAEKQMSPENKKYGTRSFVEIKTDKENLDLLLTAEDLVMLLVLDAASEKHIPDQNDELIDKILNMSSSDQSGASCGVLRKSTQTYGWMIDDPYEDEHIRDQLPTAEEDSHVTARPGNQKRFSGQLPAADEFLAR